MLLLQLYYPGLRPIGNIQNNNITVVAVVFVVFVVIVAFATAGPGTAAAAIGAGLKMISIFAGIKHAAPQRSKLNH